MKLEEIALEEIDFWDDTYRISEDLDSTAVHDSLRKIGQLNPVLLLEGDPKKRIVCGFRRLRALRQLKRTRAVARILDKSSEGRKALELAVWDNLSHRHLNTLEKARILVKLKNLFDASDDELVRIYLPSLGLRPHLNVLHSYLLLEGMHPGLRRCVGEERLTLSSMVALSSMPYEGQAVMASFMDRVQLTAGLQKKFLILLSDLAVIRNAPPWDILRNSEVAAITNDARLSPFQRGEKTYAILYRLRHPRVCQARDRFVENKKALGLPGSIQINVDPFFETQDLRVEFTASSAKHFRELAAELYAASRTPALERLFSID